MLSFQAEVIAPLVITGADNRSRDLETVRPEGLRPSSVRGALRWWFRAMMGGIVGAHDPLHKLETRVFGATDRASTVKIRSYPLKIELKKAYLCMNDQSGKTVRGISRSNIWRPAFHPPSKFRLEVWCDERALPIVFGCLWLLAVLGGVGARVRRGFGSLAFSLEEGSLSLLPCPDFSYPDSDLNGLRKYLEEGLKLVHEVFSQYAAPIPTTLPPTRFSVLSGGRLWLVRPQGGFWKSWNCAMDDLRERIYRAYKQKAGLSEIGSANPRLASPLLIQIKRAAEGKCFGILLAFDEGPNPRKYLKTGRIDFPGFLNGLRDFEVKEVSLP